MYKSKTVKNKTKLKLKKYTHFKTITLGELMPYWWK